MPALRRCRVSSDLGKFMKSVHLSVLASAVGLALAGGSTAAIKANHANLSAASAETSAVDSANPSGRYFINFVEPGAARYNGGVAGLAATAAHVDGVSVNSSRKLQLNSNAAHAYRAYLAQQRAQHIAGIESAIGAPLQIRFTFDVTRNAVSVPLTAEQAARIEQMASDPNSGIASVTLVGVKQVDTFRGPKFIGADKIWDGTAVPTYDMATRGQGVKVGVIDTGTNTAHPSFANDPACGFSATQPKLFPRDCTSTDANTGVCDGPDANVGPMPDDDRRSHGVHTSSTAAGNTIDNTATPAPLLPDGVTMSGVAPCASVYAYRVADHADGSLYDDYLTAAFENAIIDQVDVVNYSIGPTCGGGNPWGDTDFLDMEASDIFIASSAGNTRSTCTSPIGLVANNGPWQLTVAASTQDEILSPQLSVTGPGTIDPQLVGVSLNPAGPLAANPGDPLPPSPLQPPDTTNLTNATLRTYPANLIACTASGVIPAGTFAANEIAVVQRGTCTFTEKVVNAYNAGARMIVIANIQGGTTPLVPGLNLTQAMASDVAVFGVSDATVSDALIAFVNNHEPPANNPDLIFANGFDISISSFAVGDYSRAAVGQRQGDVLAGFSFRGPTQAPYDGLTKPDITGPGVDIYAAEGAADGSYGLMSGTSMSSPHLAGAAALVRAVKPSWSPMEVKSALMTTAKIDGFQEDGTTQWTVDQVGSGRVDLTKATRAGLTMDETVDRFVAANPTGGTLDMRQLNLPSMRNVACGASCTWTRTFKNRLNAQGTWTPTAVDPAGYHLTFSPASITVQPGFTASITITATATGAPTTDISFGRVDLHEGNNRSPDQHLTVAVRGVAPTPSDTVTCTGTNCTFKVDQLVSSFGALGCADWATCAPGLLWLNRFTPNASDYPITITKVSTIFGNGTGWNTAGDKISVFVYQDNDSDPTNGATPVGTPTVYTIGTPANAFVDITLNPPVVVTGPGDVLIALSNPNSSNTGGRPSSWDAGPFMNRSYLGDASGDGTTAPDLVNDSGLILNSDANATWNKNWLIRATGTKGNGQPIVLGVDTAPAK